MSTASFENIDGNIADFPNSTSVTESDTTPIVCISPNNYSLSFPESVSNPSSPDEGVPPPENEDLLKKMRLKNVHCCFSQY